ncbi:MAG: ABC transporter substrate-binding protein [Chloroflexia bacterium]
MRRLLDLAIIASLALLVYLVWLGQQRPVDRYMEAMQASGVLRVGIDPTYPPFDTLLDGKVAGYDAAIADAIAADLAVRVEFKTLALDTLYDALEAGAVDMLISALPIIPERMGVVRYSTPYYQAGQVLLVRSGDTRITSIEGLQSRTIGVEKGSAADTEARRLSREVAQNILVRSLYLSAEDALSALAKGELDAAITDGVSAQSYMRSNPGSLAIVPPAITDEPYVVAVPAQAPALASSVDSTILRLRASGDLDHIMGGR